MGVCFLAGGQRPLLTQRGHAKDKGCKIAGFPATLKFLQGNLMKLIVASVALAAALTGGRAMAQTTTYTVTAGNFTAPFINNSTCNVWACVSYSAADGASGTITLSAPLAPNLTNADFGPLVTGYSLSDGQQSYNLTAPAQTIQQAIVSTNGAGAITAFTFWVVKTPGAPFNTAGGADLNSRVSAFIVSDGYTNASFNRECNNRGGSSAASGAAACSTSSPDTNTSSVFGPGATLAAPVVAAAVPTMTEWAMILFGTLLAGGAAMYIQRRCPIA